MDRFLDLFFFVLFILSIRTVAFLKLCGHKGFGAIVLDVAHGLPCESRFVHCGPVGELKHIVLDPTAHFQDLLGGYAFAILLKHALLLPFSQLKHLNHALLVFGYVDLEQAARVEVSESYRDGLLSRVSLFFPLKRCTTFLDLVLGFLYLEHLVGAELLSFVSTPVVADVRLVITVAVVFVYSQVAPALGVLDPDDISSVEVKLFFQRRVTVSVGTNCPFFKLVLTHISFVPLEYALRYSSPKRRPTTAVRLVPVLLDWIFRSVFVPCEVHVGVLLLVVQQDLIPVHNSVALLAVLEPRGYLEADPTGNRLVCQLKFLASFVLFGALFRHL